MAKVALDGTINIQGTKEIDRANLAQLREPTIKGRGDCGRTVRKSVRFGALRSSRAPGLGNGDEDSA